MATALDRAFVGGAVVGVTPYGLWFLLDQAIVELARDRWPAVLAMLRLVPSSLVPQLYHALPMLLLATVAYGLGWRSFLRGLLLSWALVLWLGALQLGALLAMRPPGSGWL